MLRVVYTVTSDLESGRTVTLDESRGRVDIKVRAHATPQDFVPALNAALARFVGECGWFQIWRGQIISADSPDSPLNVQYVIDSDVSLRALVQIREDRGEVRLHVHPQAPIDLLVRFLNPAIEKFLAGGQWFQLWEGEIVTMDSSEAFAA